MVTEIVGIFGGCFFLIGFIQVSSGRWNGRSFWYEVTNLLGAILLVYYAVQKQAYTNIVLNLIWGVIAAYAIHHMVVRHKLRKVNKKKRKTKRRT